MERDLDSTLLHLTRVRLTQDYPAQINACIDVLTDEELWWRPHEQTNAVANLVLHLSWSNRYYLEQAIAGRDIARSREAEFSARDGFPKSRLLEIWGHSLGVVEEVLAGLQAGQMTEVTDRTGKPTTYGQILLHVTHHNAAHMGQIVWITKMRHAGALDELWMKSRAR
jgi:uncharacterized damage-inducible protein DinB